MSKTVGGDMPVWNTDMDRWLNSELTILDNPGYVSSDGCFDCDTVEVSGTIHMEEENVSKS